MGKKLLVGLWIVVGFAAVAYLHRLHLTPVASAQVAETTFTAPTALRLTHYLSPHCGCSQLLTDYFTARGPSEFTETMVLVEAPPGLVGEKLARRLRRAGFRVERSAGEGLSGLPLLEISDAQATLRYRGGYTRGAITPFSQIEDLHQARRILKAADVPPYLAFGCAVAQSLVKSLDPLGVKGL